MYKEMLKEKGIDWDSLPVALQSNKIDCVIAGQSITAERLQTVDFTTPYYYASIVALTKNEQILPTDEITVPSQVLVEKPVMV